LDIDAMPRVMAQFGFLPPTQSGLFDIVQKSRITHREVASIESATYNVQKSGANASFPPIAEIQSCLEVVNVNKNKSKTSDQPGSPAYHPWF
jgi:hypothetical protein